MHTGAAACFVLALFFYSFAWSSAATGLAILGVFFELAAWVVLFATHKKS